MAALALCLFGDGTALRNSRLFEAASAEILAVLRSPGTQWMVFLCAGMYLVAFAAIRWRSAGAKPETYREKALEVQRERCMFWLLGLVAVATLLYGLHYPQACKSTQALTLVGAAMLGQAVRFTTGEQQRSKGTKSESWFLLGVVVLLAVAAVWHPESGRDYQYRTQARWTGPWDNPNTFGGLMGAGTVLAVGMALRMGYKVQVTGCRLNQSAKWGGWLTCTFFVVTAGIVGFGLVKSYSRGAWVGTALALAYLAYQTRISRIGTKAEGETRLSRIGTKGKWFVLIRGIRVSWLAVLLSLAVLAFWCLRDTEWLPARRAASVANANDFSWRNRVAAWEGALQMMAEKPCSGYGWNQPERIYDQFFRPSKLSEGAAIQLNDYLTLGTTLGLPALVCFVVYAGFCFRSRLQGAGDGLQGAGYRLQVEPPLRGQTRTSPIPTNASASSRITHHASRIIPHSAFRIPHSLSPVTRHPSLALVCRAAALVLLVGFWFDGGLFKLAPAATFWVLLELSRED